MPDVRIYRKTDDLRFIALEVDFNEKRASNLIFISSELCYSTVVFCSIPDFFSKSLKLSGNRAEVFTKTYFPHKTRPSITISLTTQSCETTAPVIICNYTFVVDVHTTWVSLELTKRQEKKCAPLSSKFQEITRDTLIQRRLPESPKTNVCPKLMPN